MKQNKHLLSEQEWEQIVSDAFSPDAKSHVFSDRYEENKQKMEESFMSKRHFKLKKPLIAAVAVAAAAVLVPSAAFAAVNLRGILHSSGKYEQEVVIPVSDVSAQPMALDIGWMPEDIALNPDSGKYDGDNGRGITLSFYRAEKNGDSFGESENNVIDSQQYTCGENTVLCLQRNNVTNEESAFDRVVWVMFPNEKYAVQMYVTKSLTEDELKQIAENMSLTPAETETASIWTKQEDNAEAVINEPIPNISDMEVYHVGETVRSDADFDDLTIRVDNVTIQDNFDGLHTDGCGQEMDYRPYLNADGKITSTRTWYRLGDGVNTVDEKLREENVTMKVVVVDLTYTNINDISREICVCPDLFRLNENGETIPPHTVEEDNTYFRESLGVTDYDNLPISFATDHSFSKNNITDLAPGESAKVTVAFLVDADITDDLYFNTDLGNYQQAIQLTEAE